jgi:nucleoside-diphosphate-sugar epimerase
MDPSSQNRAGAGAAGRLLVVAGAGDVGGRLATSRVASGDDVIALRRREVEPAPGVRGLRADLATGEGLARLPRRAEALVFCAAPDRRDEAAYRALYVDGLRRLLDACEAPRVIFVSSTAVYREDAGEWVDEATPPEPPAFNGQALLAAEQALTPHPGGIALRLSGLYGPGREMMLRKARAGEPGRPHWTNRIHVEDAASALSWLIDHAAPEPLYLGSDDLPAKEAEVLAWLRGKEGLSAVAAAPGAESGRRIRNTRLRATGWAPVFPDYRSGYADVLAKPGV